MGVRILVGREQGSKIDGACLFDGTTGTAFGQVFHDMKDLTAEDVASQFLDWHTANYGDPRRAFSRELEERYVKFIQERGLVE